MKRQLIVIALIMLVCSVSAQSLTDPNAIALPSVNNKFFVSNTAYNVSLYTGTTDIDIPVYTMPSKGTNIPVSLSYVGARGIKVQDVANYVGLGWQINASGSVTRMVRGLPDEQLHGYIGQSGSGAQIATMAQSGTADVSLLSQIGTGALDGEPDIFSVRTPFFSFQFVFDKDGNPVFPNNTGYKISPNHMINDGTYAYASFVITDDQGNQYFFGSDFSSREIEETSLYNQDYNFISTWYLDKIVIYNNSDIITFSYQQGPNYSVKHNLSVKTTVTGYGVISGENTINTKDVSSTAIYKSPKYLSAITTSVGVLNFSYQFDRRDLTNAARLTDITLNAYDPVTGQLGSANRRYSFNYSYFGDPSADTQALRLRLDYINLYSNSSTDPPLKLKSFGYETSNNLPSRNSVEFDYWGYYNVNTSGTALVPDANKNPDEARTMANVLKTVQDISGENLVLDYELNKYFDGTNNVDAGGLRIKKVSKTLPSGENIYTQYVYDDANGHSTGQVYNTNYQHLSRDVLDYWVFCEINGQVGPCGLASDNIDISENLYNTCDLNGVFVGYSSVKTVDQNGGYDISTFTNFSDFPDAPQIVPGSTSNPNYQVGSNTSLSYKRGLLTHKETYTAGGYKLSDITNVYASQEQAVSEKAYGISPIPTYADNSAWNVEWQNYNLYATNIENYAIAQSTQHTYDQQDPNLYQENVSNFTYAANKRLIHQVASTDSKGNVQTKISYYTEDAGIPYLADNEKPAISAMLQANKTGALIHTVETSNGTSVHTHNSYLSFADASAVNKVMLVNQKTFVNDKIDDAETEQFQYDINNVTLTSINKLGGPFHSTLYGYRNNYMKAKVNNALNTSSISYGQGTVNGIIYLINTTQEASINFTVTSAGSITLHLNTNYVSNNSSKLSYSLSGPVSRNGTLCSSYNNTCGSTSADVVLSNITPGNYTLLTTAYNEYDNNLDPVIDGTISLNYSYTGYVQSVTAANEFFYEGFEESSVGTTTTTPFAGKRYYAGAYTVPFTMPNTRGYQVDYHYLLNGKWCAASKTYQNNMVLNDGSAVDEVRVYPKDAQMVSYTYDPLVGITSQGDARNRFTFYEYDHFGRLKIIRDNDQNIIKRYDYVYNTSLMQTCPKPVITGITSQGLSISISYMAPIGCTGISYSWVQNSTGATGSGTGTRIGPPFSVDLPAANQTYTISITSYSADCPLGVSDTQVITVTQ